MLDYTLAQIETSLSNLGELIRDYNLLSNSSLDKSCQDSKEIETVLIRLPIKPLVLMERNAGKSDWVIINPSQISSILNYIKDDFNLSNLKYLDINGKYSEIEPMFKRRLQQATLTLHILPYHMPSNILEDVLDRLI